MPGRAGGAGLAMQMRDRGCSAEPGGAGAALRNGADSCNATSMPNKGTGKLAGNGVEMRNRVESGTVAANVGIRLSKGGGCLVGLDDVVPRTRRRRVELGRSESGFGLATWLILQRRARNIGLYPGLRARDAYKCKLVSLLEQDSSALRFLIGGPRCEMKRTQWAGWLRT